MEKLANIFISQLDSYSLIEKKNEEIYRYVIVTWMEQFITLLAIISLGLFFELLFQTIVFIIFFRWIKKRSGGYHTNHFSTCFFGTILIYALFVKIIFPYMNSHWLFSVLLFCGALVAIVLIGAINHPNMDWTREEYLSSKQRTREIVLIESGVITVLIALNAEKSFVLFMMFAIVLSAILLLVAKIIKQEV